MCRLCWWWGVFVGGQLYSPAPSDAGSACLCVRVLYSRDDGVYSAYCGTLAFLSHAIVTKIPGASLDDMLFSVGL